MEALKPTSKKGAKTLQLLQLTPPVLLANSKNAITVANQREQQLLPQNSSANIFSDQTLSQKLIKDFKQSSTQPPVKVLPFEAYLKQQQKKLMMASTGGFSRNAKRESAMQRWAVFYKTQQLQTIQSANSDHQQTASQKTKSNKERELMNIQALQATQSRTAKHDKKKRRQLIDGSLDSSSNESLISRSTVILEEEEAKKSDKYEERAVRRNLAFYQIQKRMERAMMLHEAQNSLRIDSRLHASSGHDWVPSKQLPPNAAKKYYGRITAQLIQPIDQLLNRPTLSQSRAETPLYDEALYPRTAQNIVIRDNNALNAAHSNHFKASLGAVPAMRMPTQTGFEEDLQIVEQPNVVGKNLGPIASQVKLFNKNQKYSLKNGSGIGNLRSESVKQKHRIPPAGQNGDLSPIGSFRVLTDKDAKELAERYLHQALQGQPKFTPWDEPSVILRESHSQGRLPTPPSDQEEAKEDFIQK
ncbi:hypothetical protein FGO68_gene14725 [Halteria grandinella]|uniref:Uncharacterized protein n=1 Tax=Halteria grandinella TaxID=5974 RepID=A0A8J8P2I5_HALGN|nr:hypothetical protein FGO68_gene14725 [Halteria grandinella]